MTELVDTLGGITTLEKTTVKTLAGIITNERILVNTLGGILTAEATAKRTLAGKIALEEVIGGGTLAGKITLEKEVVRTLAGIISDQHERVNTLGGKIFLEVIRFRTLAGKINTEKINVKSTLAGKLTLEKVIPPPGGTGNTLAGLISLSYWTPRTAQLVAIVLKNAHRACRRGSYASPGGDHATKVKQLLGQYTGTSPWDAAGIAKLIVEEVKNDPGE